MNFKKNATKSENVPEQKTALESLLVNRFDTLTVKVNTIGEQYTINSQQIKQIEKNQADLFDLMKSVFGKVSAIEKAIADTLKGDTGKKFVSAVVSTATPPIATNKKVKGLTINEERFLELREEMTQEDYPDFEKFYVLVKTFCKATNYKVFGKKDMQKQAKELWEKEISHLDPMTQELDESPFLFPEKPIAVETKSPPSQTQVWSETMGIDKALLDKAVSGVRQCTEEELEIKSVLEFLKVDLHSPSIKAFSKWILSLCKTG